MCGIAGFISERNDRAAVLKKMTDALIHRGPDAEGFWLDEHSGMSLGHRRLSIRDLSDTGAQPMQSADGRFVLVYNGEIYNAEELKAKILEISPELKFRGSSDTELLLEGFARLGIKKTLDFSKGMFAFALYDRKEKELWLVRDRIGEKPLYYGRVGKDFVFASELSAITEYPGFTGKIDRSVIPAYLLYGYISAPASIYEGIHKLMPGGILRLRAPFGEEQEKRGRWYSLKKAAETAERFKGSFEEATEELERLLLEAVRGQLASDVPLGAYLSGGIDSSTVVALMSRLCPGKVESFSIGFDSPEYDEAPEAAAIARHLGTIHTERYVTERELLNVIPKIPSIYGEPYADSSQIPTYLVSELAKSRVTVSLSGDAGDELFCGYRTYPQIEKLWKKLRLMPQPLRKAAGAVAGIAGADVPKLYRAGMCLGARNIVELKEAVDHYDPLIDRLTASPLSIRRPGICEDRLQAMMRDDLLRYHPEDILVKVDRAGMAVSLENRIPMLDRDVVEFALGLPSDYLYDGKKQKKILKAVLAKYVPESLTERPKKGFAVPLTKWLKEGETADWAAELTEHSRAAADGLIRGSELKRLRDGFDKSGRSPRLLWNVLMLEQWYRERNKT